MIEKTSLNVTGETFLCPYCQTWLEKNEDIVEKDNRIKTQSDVIIACEYRLKEKNEINNHNEAVLSETVAQLNTLIKEKERILETERDHYKFLENLVKALYGEGWDELTINDAKEWNERIAKKNEEIAALISEGGRGD